MTSTPRLAVTSALTTRHGHGLPRLAELQVSEHGEDCDAYPEREVVGDVLVEDAHDRKKQEHGGQYHRDEHPEGMPHRCHRRVEDGTHARRLRALPGDCARVHVREPEDTDRSKGEEEHIEVGLLVPADPDQGTHEDDAVDRVLGAVNMHERPHGLHDPVLHLLQRLGSRARRRLAGLVSWCCHRRPLTHRARAWYRAVVAPEQRRPRMACLSSCPRELIRNDPSGKTGGGGHAHRRRPGPLAPTIVQARATTQPRVPVRAPTCAGALIDDMYRPLRRPPRRVRRPRSAVHRVPRRRSSSTRRSGRGPRRR